MGDGNTNKIGPSLAGNSLGAGAILMSLVLVGAEVVELDVWSAATTPKFIGEMFVQIGTVVGAYFGGRMTLR